MKETNAKVTCYLDFDGTLSGRTGRDTVFDPLYRSLQKDSKSYGETEFKDEKEMVALLTKGFESSKNQDMKMVAGAKEFLKAMQDLNANIVIISRNREEYIKAILALEGFDSTKFKIFDCNSKIGDGKNSTVTDCLKYDKAHIYVVADDDRNDFREMTHPVLAKINSSGAGFLVTETASPGSFDFEKMTRGVKGEIASKEREDAANSISKVNQHSPVVDLNVKPVRYFSTLVPEIKSPLTKPRFFSAPKHAQMRLQARPLLYKPHRNGLFALSIPRNRLMGNIVNKFTRFIPR